MNPEKKADLRWILLCVLLGYLYSVTLWNDVFWPALGELFPNRNLYLVFLGIFAVAFLAGTLWIAKEKGRKLGTAGRIRLLFFLLGILWMFLSPEDFDAQPFTGVMVIYLHAMGVYFAVTILGIDDSADEPVFRGLWLGLLIWPIRGFLRIWPDLFERIGNWVNKGREEGRTKKFRGILLGFAMAIPVLCIVIPLLCADPDFAAFFSTVWDWFTGLFDWTLPEFILDGITVVTAVIACHYFYGLFINASEHACEPAKQVRFGLSEVVRKTFLWTILAVYLLYVGAKAAAVPGLLSDIFAGDMWASTFARQGFFEMCEVCAINFAIFSFLTAFFENTGKNMKLPLVLLCVITVLFILLNLFKMGVYIHLYRFTFKRVFTSWFMIVLGITFTLKAITLEKKIPAMRISALIGIVSFLLLAFSNLRLWLPV